MLEEEHNHLKEELIDSRKVQASGEAYYQILNEDTIHDIISGLLVNIMRNTPPLQLAQLWADPGMFVMLGAAVSRGVDNSLTMDQAFHVMNTDTYMHSIVMKQHKGLIGEPRHDSIKMELMDENDLLLPQYEKRFYDSQHYDHPIGQDRCKYACNGI